MIRDGRLVGVGHEADKSQLDFLKDASVLNTVYIDPSNFIQIPDKIKSSAAIRDVAEFDVHPSKKLAMLWNPDLVSKEEVYNILQQPPGEFKETVDEISFDDLNYLFEREFKLDSKAKSLIKIKGVHRGYRIFGKNYPVIKGIDLDIKKGDFVFISGPSGVGKTTLLNLIAGLLTPDEGTITVDGFKISHGDDTERSNFRLANTSYITQYHSLFEPIELRDNLLIPYLFQGKEYDPRLGEGVAKQCHIQHKLDSYPDELSAGEKQRATLTLALTRRTQLLLADEPTANMDSDLARALMDVLIDAVEENNATFVMCSHDLSLLRPGFRHIRISDGKITEDSRVTMDSLRIILKEYLQIQEENNHK